MNNPFSPTNKVNLTDLVDAVSQNNPIPQSHQPQTMPTPAPQSGNNVSVPLPQPQVSAPQQVVGNDGEIITLGQNQE